MSLEILEKSNSEVGRMSVVLGFPLMSKEPMNSIPMLSSTRNQMVLGLLDSGGWHLITTSAPSLTVRCSPAPHVTSERQKEIEREVVSLATQKQVAGPENRSKPGHELTLAGTDSVFGGLTLPEDQSGQELSPP